LGVIVQDRHGGVDVEPVGVAMEVPILAVGIDEPAVGERELLQVRVDVSGVEVERRRRRIITPGIEETLREERARRAHVVGMDAIVILQRVVVVKVRADAGEPLFDRFAFDDIGSREILRRGEGGKVPADRGVAIAIVTRMLREHVERQGEDLAVPGVFLGLGVALDLRRRDRGDESVGFIADHAGGEHFFRGRKIVPQQPRRLTAARGPEGGLPLVLQVG
jgi:hypothetical protein